MSARLASFGPAASRCCARRRTLVNIDDPFSLFDCATDALFRFGEPFKVVNAVPVAVRVGQVDTTISKNSGGRRCSRNCKRRVVYVAQYDTTRLHVVANSTKAVYQGLFEGFGEGKSINWPDCL